MTKDKLDIGEVLKNINAKNYNWFSSLAKEEQETFVPFVVMQFLSGSGEEDLIVLNDFVNTDFSDKSKNKELFYRLCCVVGSGGYSKRKYMKPPKVKREKESKVVWLVSEYIGENLTYEEALNFVKKNFNLYDEDFWGSIAQSYNWSNDAIKSLEKEIIEMVG